MRALLIDDERPARRELRGLLDDHGGVEIVGEAANIAEAARLVAEHRPDLLFLDIEMPGGDGFSLLEALPPPHPLVIFTTAYSEHAVRAFEINSLDYLLKPIATGRLAAALEKAAARLRLRPPAGGPTPTVAPFAEDDQVFLRSGDRCWFVPVRTIVLVEADGNQTRVHFGKDSAVLSRTLNAMEERLPARLFIRANRHQLVNLHMIATIGDWFSRTLRVVLTDGRTIEFSRRQALHFRETLSL